MLQIWCDIDVHLMRQIKAAIASAALYMSGVLNARQPQKSS